jgi:restriction endonuclease S subunit
MANLPLRPLKYEVAINSRTLPETADPTLLLRYVDIGSVDSLGRVSSAEELTFGNAPSRARRLPSAGDTIVSTVRTYLRAIAYIDGADPSLVCSTGFAVVTPGKRVHAPYLAYWMRSDPVVDEICARSTGVSYPAINASEIGCLPIPLLTIERQRLVADFLDAKTAAIDALIAKKERLVELLQHKRQALITQVVTNGLNPNVPMQESGFPWLGMVPKHWQLLRLKQLSHRISGRLVYQPAQYFSDEGVPFIMGNNVSERGISLEETKFIPAEVNARFAHHALRVGDVVMVRVGAPGLTAVVGAEADGLNCGSLMIVRRNSAFHSAWLAAVMNSPVVRAQIDLVQYGAAQEQINITDAVNFWIPTPPPDEQRVIAERVRAVARQIDGVADKLGEQIARLREYRQALITAAVTGNIDVSAEAA